MKIQVTHYDKTVTIEEEANDHDIYQMVDIFKKICLAMGFHPDTVEVGFGGYIEDD